MEALLAAIERNAATTDRLLEVAETLREVRQTPPRQPETVGGKAEIRIDAGGIALWFCATFCAVSLVCVLFLAGAVNWLANRTVDQGHQMNALYMSVPGLRELVDEQTRLRDQTSAAPKEETKP